MLGKNFMALRLSYLKSQLSHSVKGYFGFKNSHPVVYVTKDLEDESINPHRYHAFRTTSRKGKIYSELVRNYQNLQNEYNKLIDEWNYTYRLPIPEYKFPIAQTCGRSDMNYNYFLNCKSNCNPISTARFKFDGDSFSSKNEVIVAKGLKELSIPYKVEPEVKLVVGNNEIVSVYPDFVIGLIEANKSIYIEVVGGLGIDGYDYRTANKIINYQKNGYQDMADIIILYVSDDFDVDYIIGKIVAALELIAPTI